MKQIWRLALNDLRLTVRDRPAFAWMLILPLSLMWLFGSVFGGSSNPDPKIALGIVDRDGGWLARAFVEELQDEQIDLREIAPEEYATAENKVRTLVIPERFTERVLAGQQQVLRLEKEADSNQEFGLAGQMHVVRTIVRTLGRLVELGGGISVTETPADGTLSPNDESTLIRFRALGDRPRLVDLEVSTAGRGRPVPSGFNQSVPGILTMIVLMMTLIYGAVFLTIEKRSGMLRRQASLPMGRGRIFAGKLVGRLLIAGLQLVMLVAAGRFLFGVSWGNSPLGLALVLLSFAFAVASLATLLGALLKTPEQASAVGWLGSMFLAGLGGCWWPAEVMPGWLQTASHALPTAWAMDGFHGLISFGHGVEGVWLPVVALVGFGVVFSVLGGRWLRFE